MSYYQICLFWKIALLLTIIITVKSRPDETTTEIQTDVNSDNAAWDGLNVTGEFDKNIKKFLLSPRCGVSNKNLRINNRRKRYVLHGNYWNIKSLTYNILNYTLTMNETEVDNEIARAFSLWSEQTNLMFTHQKTAKVDITIEFVKSHVRQSVPFDGFVAYASFSKKNAFIHFNDNLYWIIDSLDGINLFQVAAHEIGHVLGLKHSHKGETVMIPHYDGYKPNFKLDDDDIQAIQYLYGKKFLPNINGPFRNFAVPSSNKSMNDLLPSVAQDNDLCKNPKIDAIFNSADNQTYVFKGEKYYKLAGYSVADGYPKLISDGWPGLPGDIDAAFTYKNGKTYFFKGTRHWRYNGSQMDVGYSKEISEGFPDIPNNLDTAVAWGDSGEVFFFKGNTFWSFDPTRNPLVTSSHIRIYLNWKGLPGNLDAANVDEYGSINFFKNDRLYQINTANKTSVISTLNYFSLRSGVMFGCFDLNNYTNALKGRRKTTI